MVQQIYLIRARARGCSGRLHGRVRLAEDSEVAAAIDERKQALDAATQVEAEPSAPAEPLGKKGRGRSSKGDVAKAKPEQGRAEPAGRAKAKGAKVAVAPPGEPVEVVAAVDNGAVDREYFAGHGSRVVCVGFVEHS
eukprot:5587820-Prymnesium_polylepis.1